MLYTTAYNSYWEKYGERFENACKALETKADRIVIISDVAITTDYENIVMKDHDAFDTYSLGKYRQKALTVCDCDWLVQIDIDDIMYPNYLNNINDSVDWHIFSMKNNECVMHNLNHHWDNFFQGDLMSPFGGLSNSAFKTSTLNRVGGYKGDIGWEDLILVCDLKFNNCTIFADTTELRGERIMNNAGSLTSRTTSNIILCEKKIAETNEYRKTLSKLYAGRTN